MREGVLQDKVAMVTGAGRGIGAGIARVFAAEGARVVVATRTAEHGRRTVDDITAAGGVAVLATLDIGTLAGAEQAVAAAIDNYGRIDVMVHNAGSLLGGPVDAYSEDDLETVLAVNLKACFRLSRLCIPHFRRQGGGRLLFTSSVTGPRVAMPGASYYAASKGGVNGFIRTAALELARENITVNGVEPGYIRTAAMELLADEDGMRQMAKYIPVGYLGDPEDVAWAMVYLASDQARYVTGQTIVVDGGSTLPESPVFMEETEGTKEGLGSPD